MLSNCPDELGENDELIKGDELSWCDSMYMQFIHLIRVLVI